MIKGLMGSQGVTVMCGDTALPYIPMNSENPIQGMIRVHGTDMQVFDGSMWTTLATSYATVTLDPRTQDLLNWVEAYRNKQLERERLIKDNPALQKAVDAIHKAEANFDILAKFVEDDNRTT